MFPCICYLLFQNYIGILKYRFFHLFHHFFIFSSLGLIIISLSANIWSVLVDSLKVGFLLNKLSAIQKTETLLFDIPSVSFVWSLLVETSFWRTFDFWEPKKKIECCCILCSLKFDSSLLVWFFLSVVFHLEYYLFNIELFLIHFTF